MLDLLPAAGAHLGDVLVATAEERGRAGRSGLYDIRVCAGERVVAEFRGQSRTLGETFFPEEA